MFRRLVILKVLSTPFTNISVNSAFGPGISSAFINTVTKGSILLCTATETFCSVRSGVENVVGFEMGVLVVAVVPAGLEGDVVDTSVAARDPKGVDSLALACSSSRAFSAASRAEVAIA